MRYAPINGETSSLSMGRYRNMEAHLLGESGSVKLKKSDEQYCVLPVGLGASGLDFLIPASGAMEKIRDLLLRQTTVCSGTDEEPGKNVERLSLRIGHGIPPQQEEEYS